MTEGEHHCYSNCPNHIQHTNKLPFSKFMPKRIEPKKPNSKTIGKFTCSLIRFAFKKPGIKIERDGYCRDRNKCNRKFRGFINDVRHLSLS